MKSNYDPVFQETFFFDTSHGVPQAGLVFSLYDYNAVNKDELLATVGCFTLFITSHTPNRFTHTHTHTHTPCRSRSLSPGVPPAAA